MSIAAFNGVGVPGNELPQDERIRLQFVSRNSAF